MTAIEVAGFVASFLPTRTAKTSPGRVEAFAVRPELVPNPCRVPAACRQHVVTMSSGGNQGSESIDAMRSRLEGLIGSAPGATGGISEGEFNGKMLRIIMKTRFSVEYDIQPVVRGNCVYLHIMWRYFEQVSFYMDEEQWSEHMEAVADLLKKWGAVNYFCDYITKVKKRRKFY